MVSTLYLLIFRLDKLTQKREKLKNELTWAVFPIVYNIATFQLVIGASKGYGL